MSGLWLVCRSVGIIVVRAAERRPEENRSFRLAPEARTFGQLAAHVADTHQVIGGILPGERLPAAGVAKTKTTKAEIVAAPKDPVACVDKGSAMGDAKAAGTVELFERDAPRREGSAPDRLPSSKGLVYALHSTGTVECRA